MKISALYLNRLSNNHSGFSLVEILLVSLLIAISLASFVPLSKTIEKRTLSTTVSELVSDLESVQNRSITAENNLSYGLELNSNDYSMLTKDDDGGVSIFLVKKFPKKIHPSSTPVSIIFNKQTGYLQNAESDVSFVLQSNNYQVTITVSQNGVINITDLVSY